MSITTLHVHQFFMFYSITMVTLSDRKYEECRVQVRGNLVLNLVIVSSDHELIMSTKSNIYDCCHEKRALTITFSEIHIFCQFGLANCSWMQIYKDIQDIVFFKHVMTNLVRHVNTILTLLVEYVMKSRTSNFVLFNPFQLFQEKKINNYLYNCKCLTISTKMNKNILNIQVHLGKSIR